MDGGGVVSLVGATGVGKTTLIAKLAARWVLRHGTRDVALITTDAVRIGAQEQIHTLGRLLGIPAYAIDGAAEVASALEHLQDKRLILIDTAGLSPRDPRLEQELATLASASKRMETTLVLSAATQAGAIEEAVADLRSEGKGVSSLHLTFIQPMPPGIKEILAGFKKVVTIENNWSDDPNDEIIDEDNWLFTSELQDDDGKWMQFMTGKHTRA